jgi:thiamine-monophosphate kinase
LVVIHVLRLTGLTISVTAIGEVESGKEVCRNTANVDDLICVSGDLGGAYMGLQLLEREKVVFKTDPNMKPKFEGYEYILQRQLKPEARKDVVEMLKEIDIFPTSMIDVSDGLSSEIMHICKQSNKGCKIFEEKIPIHHETKRMAGELNIDPTICALNGGEDYELLFTIRISDFEKIKSNPYFSVIGHITSVEHGLNLVARDGTFVALQAQGWNAFPTE